MGKKFSALLAAILATATCVSSMALTLDSAETLADETNSNAQATETLAENTPDIPLLDNDYGKLIYYQNMEVEVADANADPREQLKANLWTDKDCIGGGTYSASGVNLRIRTDPTNADNKALYTYGPGGWQQFIGYFSDFAIKPGTYTLVYDIYYPTNTPDGAENVKMTNRMDRFFATYKGNGNLPKDVYGNRYDKNDLISRNPAIPAKDSWQTNTDTLVLSSYEAGADYNSGYTLAYAGGTLCYFPNDSDGKNDMKITEFRLLTENGAAYFDNIRIYCMSEELLNFKVDDVNSIAESDSDGNFTFPAVSEISEDYDRAFYGWLCNNKIYQPGEKVAKAEVGGKTAVPMECKLVDDELGELVVLFDYEINTTPSYFNTEYGNYFNKTFYASNGIGGVRMTTVNGMNVGEVYPNSDQATASFAFAKADISTTVPGKYSAQAGFILPEGVGKEDFKNCENLWLRVSVTVPGEEPGKFKTSDRDTFSGKKSEVNSTTPVYGHSTTTGLKLQSVGINNTRTSGTLNSYCFDNYAVYVLPTNEIIFTDGIDSQTYAKDAVAEDATTYTFKSAEELGLEADVTFWVDASGNAYEVGDTVAIDDVRYKVFSAVYQDASVPAMGFAYEGDTLGQTGGTYRENIEDDGRTVLHVNQYKLWNADNTGNARWSDDVRVYLYGDGYTPFDPREYAIVDYMYKVTKASSVPSEHRRNKDYDPAVHGEPIPNATPEMKFWYATLSKEGKYWIANDGEQRITNANVKLNADSKYHNLSFDMRTTKSNPKVPYMDAALIGGFAVDPSTCNWENDIYIDYIRAYRVGYATIKYDTNAPEGANVISEVAPEKNRGVGTGYLLTGVRPEVEGYVFLGWSLTADGTETVEAIDVTGNETVYAVWAEADNYGAAKTNGKVEIKNMGDGKSAIRFHSTVTNAVKSNMDELGFIVTREVLLPKNGETVDYSALTHSLKKAGKNENLFVEGVAYDSTTDATRGQDEDSAEWIYTALCTGIPVANYSENIVIRPYAKYFINNREVIIYGNTEKSSVKEVAQSIYDAEDKTVYNENKDYIDGILAE